MERRITVLTDVKDLAELVRGARVEAARVAATAGQLSLEIALSRADRRSRLTLGGVRDVTLQPAAGERAGGAPLMSCDAVPGGYTFTVHTANGWRFTGQLDRLEGRFSDHG